MKTLECVEVYTQVCVFSYRFIVFRVNIQLDGRVTTQWAEANEYSHQAIFVWDFDGHGDDWMHSQWRSILVVKLVSHVVFV